MIWIKEHTVNKIAIFLSVSSKLWDLERKSKPCIETSHACIANARYYTVITARFYYYSVIKHGVGRYNTVKCCEESGEFSMPIV